MNSASLTHKETVPCANIASKSVTQLSPDECPPI